MTFLDGCIIILTATAVVATLAFGVDAALRRRRLPVGLDDLTPTIVDRPTLNEANKPLVSVLYAVASSIEASGLKVSDGLRDIARTLQLAADPAPVRIVERVADFVDEHGVAIRVDAQRIKEA